MNFTIRTANVSDLEKIMEIERDAFIPEIQEDRDVFLERLTTFGRGFLIFETEVDGGKKAAGYFSAELWNEVPESKDSFKIGHSINDSHVDGGKVLYISSFAVLSEFRGCGNGKRLFSMAVDYLRQVNSIEKIVLMVNELWGGAHHIYSSYGFAEIFRIESIFPAKSGNATAGIVMILD